MGRQMGVRGENYYEKKKYRNRPVVLKCCDCKYEIGTKCTHPCENEKGFYDNDSSVCFSPKVLKVAKD